MERDETMPFCIRYDTVKVKANLALEIVTLSKLHDIWSSNSDDIHLPLGVLAANSLMRYKPHNTGEKDSISYKGYFVDEIDDGIGYRFFYPTTYKDTGIFYKINADDYYENTLFPNVNIKATLNDDYLMHTLYDERVSRNYRIIKEKAPDYLIEKTNKQVIPKELDGKELVMNVSCLHVKTEEEDMEIPIKNWMSWIHDLDDAVAEGEINGMFCFVPLWHLKQL